MTLDYENPLWKQNAASQHQQHFQALKTLCIELKGALALQLWIFGRPAPEEHPRGSSRRTSPEPMSNSMCTAPSFQRFGKACPYRNVVDRNTANTIVLLPHECSTAAWAAMRSDAEISDGSPPPLPKHPACGRREEGSACSAFSASSACCSFLTSKKSLFLSP